MEELNIKYFPDIFKKYDIISKFDNANNETVFMCRLDEPIPMEIKDYIESVNKLYYPDRKIRFIEAEAVG